MHAANPLEAVLPGAIPRQVERPSCHMPLAVCPLPPLIFRLLAMVQVVRPPCNVCRGVASVPRNVSFVLVVVL